MRPERRLREVKHVLLPSSIELPGWINENFFMVPASATHVELTPVHEEAHCYIVEDGDIREKIQMEYKWRVARYWQDGTRIL